MDHGRYIANLVKVFLWHPTNQKHIKNHNPVFPQPGKFRFCSVLPTLSSEPYKAHPRCHHQLSSAPYSILPELTSPVNFCLFPELSPPKLAEVLNTFWAQLQLHKGPWYPPLTQHLSYATSVALIYLDRGSLDLSSMWRSFQLWLGSTLHDNTDFNMVPQQEIWAHLV